MKKLTEEEKQWILANYKSNQKEFGFAWMAKRFGVPKTTIETLVRANWKLSARSTFVMNFGVHRDKPLTEVPGDYVKWMLREVKISDSFRLTLENEMKHRASPDSTKEHWNDTSTHYQWTDRNGKSHWIPNNVDMSNTDNELCPF